MKCSSEREISLAYLLLIKGTNTEKMTSMNRYVPSIPRVSFIIFAAAMMAITIGVMVVVPARIGSGSEEVREAAKVVASATKVVVIPPIEVLGARESDIAAAPARHARPRAPSRRVDVHGAAAKRV